MVEFETLEDAIAQLDAGVDCGEYKREWLTNGQEGYTLHLPQFQLSASATKILSDIRVENARLAKSVGYWRMNNAEKQAWKGALTAIAAGFFHEPHSVGHGIGEFVVGVWKAPKEFDQRERAYLEALNKHPELAQKVKLVTDFCDAVERRFSKYDGPVNRQTIHTYETPIKETNAVFTLREADPQF